MDDLAHSVSLPMLTLEELGTLSQVHSSCYHSIWYFVRARYSVRPYLETFFSANEISLFLDAFRRTNAVIGGILPAVVLNCIAAPFGRLELICPSATFDVLHEFLLFANYNCESEQTPSSANLPPLPAHSTYEMGTAIQALFNYSRASTPGITVFVASRTVMETILAGPSTIHQMFISADYLIDLYPKETCIRREIVTWSTSNCLFDPFKLSLNSWIDWGWNVSASPSVVSLLSPNSSFQSHRQVGYRGSLVLPGPLFDLNNDDEHIDAELTWCPFSYSHYLLSMEDSQIDYVAGAPCGYDGTYTYSRAAEHYINHPVHPHSSRCFYCIHGRSKVYHRDLHVADITRAVVADTPVDRVIPPYPRLRSYFLCAFRGGAHLGLVKIYLIHGSGTSRIQVNVAVAFARDDVRMHRAFITLRDDKLMPTFGRNVTVTCSTLEWAEFLQFGTSPTHPAVSFSDFLPIHPLGRRQCAKLYKSICKGCEIRTRGMMILTDLVDLLHVTPNDFTRVLKFATSTNVHPLKRGCGWLNVNVHLDPDWPDFQDCLYSVHVESDYQQFLATKKIRLSLWVRNMRWG
ncbi:hypothetical protein AAF712_016201 [Marasmius tenuissimus]|uniref:Uncharacterized protein n=1 Tax=Marasmius tenuissimus TaxID=585030 RepID=A0ABR2Z8S8_9AGAR